MKRIYFSENLDYLMSEHGDSAVMVSLNTRLSASAVRGYRTGRVSPTVYPIAVLAEYYQVSIDDLIHKNLREDKP